MQLPYFFQEDLAHGEDVLSEDTSKHVVQVLRMQEGGLLQLTNGKGLLGTARIVDAHRKRCRVEVIEREQMSRGARATNQIGISLLKNTTRLEWFMEKATETGVETITPLVCERTERTAFRYDRIRGILISAMLQSRQTWLPNLENPVPFQQAIDRTLPSHRRLLAHCGEGPKESLRNLVLEDVPTCICIGPEGDFSPAEVEAAMDKGWKPVHLGNNRLRTETAAVAAAILMNL